MWIYGTYGVRAFGFELSVTLVPYGRYVLEVFSKRDRSFVAVQEFRTKRAASRAMEKYARQVAESLTGDEECSCRVVDRNGGEVDRFSAWPRLVKQIGSSR